MKIIKLLIIVMITTMLFCINIYATPWLFIGDSYFVSGAGDNEKTVPQLIAEYMKLETFYDNSRGGYGSSRPKANFLTLLNEVKNAKDVKNVLYYGGIINDRNCTKQKIQRGLGKLFYETRKKFPCVKIWYAIGNWHADNMDGSIKYQGRVNKRINWYKEICNKCNVTFFDVTYTFKRSNNKLLFKSDYHHPNLKGRKRLANEIVKNIQITKERERMYFRERARNFFFWKKKSISKKKK